MHRCIIFPHYVCRYFIFYLILISQTLQEFLNPSLETVARNIEAGYDANGYLAKIDNERTSKGSFPYSSLNIIVHVLQYTKSKILCSNILYIYIYISVLFYQIATEPLRLPLYYGIGQLIKKYKIFGLSWEKNRKENGCKSWYSQNVSF